MPQELSNTKHPSRLSAPVLCVELADFLAARAQRTRLQPSGVRGSMDFWALARFVPSEAGVRLRDLNPKTYQADHNIMLQLVNM